MQLAPSIGRLSIAIVLTLIACATVEAAAVPRSVSEALANLRRSQAPAADWEGFQAGSSVTHRRTGRSAIVGNYSEVTTQIMTERTPTALRFDMKLESGERDRWLPAATDVPELDAARAEKGGEEDLYIGSTRVHTEIYRFRYSSAGREYEQLYWLAPGVPSGVVRHRETVKYDPTYTGRTEMNLTEINLTLKAGTGTVRGYCFETVVGLRGGLVNRGKICKSDQVPGAIVSGEQREMDGTKENRFVVQTLDRFEAVR